MPDPDPFVRGPDPYQNVTDSEPWLLIRINLTGRGPDTVLKIGSGSGLRCLEGHIPASL